MSVTFMSYDKMEMEEDSSSLPTSFSSYSCDTSAIYSEDTLENRINQWLDIKGIEITDPQEREEIYFEQKRARVYSINSIGDSEKNQFQPIPLQKSIKKGSRKDSLGLINCRKFSDNINLSSSDLLQRRKKQVKKASL